MIAGATNAACGFSSWSSPNATDYALINSMDRSVPWQNKAIYSDVSSSTPSQTDSFQNSPIMFDLPKEKYDDVILALQLFGPAEAESEPVPSSIADLLAKDGDRFQSFAKYLIKNRMDKYLLRFNYVWNLQGYRPSEQELSTIIDYCFRSPKNSLKVEGLNLLSTFHYQKILDKYTDLSFSHPFLQKKWERIQSSRPS